MKCSVHQLKFHGELLFYVLELFIDKFHRKLLTSYEY